MGYIILGKVFAYIFLIICLLMLFFPKGRKKLSEIFGSTLMGYMFYKWNGDTDGKSFMYILGMGMMYLLLLTLYVLLAIVLSLLIVVIFPLPVLGGLVGLLFFKRKKKEK